MPNFNKKDGWRTKGTRQLTTCDIVQVCTWHDRQAAKGIKCTVLVECNHEFEIEKAQGAWAGFIRLNDSVYYRGVEIRKV